MAQSELRDIVSFLAGLANAFIRRYKREIIITRIMRFYPSCLRRLSGVLVGVLKYICSRSVQSTSIVSVQVLCRACKM